MFLKELVNSLLELRWPEKCLLTVNAGVITASEQGVPDGEHNCFVFLLIVTSSSPKAGVCSSCLSDGVHYCDEATLPKSKLGRKEVIWFILPDYNPALEKVRTGTQPGLEPRARSWCRGHKRMLLIGLFPMVCSICFFFFFNRTQNTSLGMAPLTIGWVIFHWSLRKCWISWKHFFNWDSFLSDDLVSRY